MPDWTDSWSDDWARQFQSWSDPNQFAHPNSPAGGSGPGTSRKTVESSPFSSLPLPGSPAGRSQTPPLLPSARPVPGSIIDRIRNAATWDELKRWAQIALGPFSFDLGVCFGIVEGVKDIGVGLFQLLKMLVLSGLYERAHAAKWYDIGPVDLFARLIDRVADDELKKAYDWRVALMNQVGEALKHPVEFFGQAKQHYVAEYAEKWKRYERMMSQPGLGSKFEAGRIAGGVLLDVVLLILTVVDGVGVAVKLAKTAPELLELARALKGAEGALKAARTSVRGAEAAEKAALAAKAEAEAAAEAERVAGQAAKKSAPMSAEGPPKPPPEQPSAPIKTVEDTPKRTEGPVTRKEAGDLMRDSDGRNGIKGQPGHPGDHVPMDGADPKALARSQPNKPVNTVFRNERHAEQELRDIMEANKDKLDNLKPGDRLPIEYEPPDSVPGYQSEFGGEPKDVNFTKEVAVFDRLPDGTLHLQTFYGEP